MNVRGWTAVAGVECSKLAAQVKARTVLVACVAGPFAFAGAMRVQNSLPEDTLFGRSVKESGFAVPLVILGFAALWVFPVLASVVGGDLFAAEDRYGTWKTLLTRSRSRSDVFAGKVVTALGFSLLSVSVLALSSMAAGVLLIGSQPLINLSGVLLAPRLALTRVVLAWTTVVLPAFGLTAVAVLLSIVTRSSVVGVGVPVVVSLLMQLYALIDGPEVIRQALITSAFGAWHGLLSEPPFYTPLFDAVAVSLAYFTISIAVARRVLRRRDIGG